ncbi:hypothetical protein [Bradyrhizobium sp. CER78]|uniref:hypothetical protein n=1 Tax=Bradyrhizobium sp. CER78 TaxID=3039162 RepID=UPI002446C723|nr:hypothetical protein [Bradyrhizobium sp. CER78]MDH2384433.1 hypothetical protein [Bradyrhizobium sp. CER78]
MSIVGSDLFICDDREHAARDAKKQLFPWYCTVLLRVVSGDVVHVELGKAMPRSDAVDAWWKAHTVEGRYGLQVIEISKGEESKLGELAKPVASHASSIVQVSRCANGIELSSAAFGANRLACGCCPPVFSRRL